jgi:hypothetical protein
MQLYLLNSDYYDRNLWIRYKNKTYNIGKLLQELMKNVCRHKLYVHNIKVSTGVFCRWTKVTEFMCIFSFWARSLNVIFTHSAGTEDTWRLGRRNIYGNSHSNLCTECPNNTNNKLTANGAFTQLLATRHASCQVATLQDYTFHRCIHADFTQLIHTHGVQPCFQEKDTYKCTKIMPINIFMIRLAIPVTEDSKPMIWRNFPCFSLFVWESLYNSNSEYMMPARW